MKRFDGVVIIGLGGTGTHLVEPLMSLLCYHPRGCREFVFVDGDSYEEKNSSRQLFPVSFCGTNKAEAKARQLEATFGGTATIEAVPVYADEAYLRNYVLPQYTNPLIIMSVDRHASRNASLAACEGLRDFVWISPGNGESSGSCTLYGMVDGQPLGLDPRIVYPDIANPTDTIPQAHSEGCQEQAVDNVQLISANAAAALGVLFMVQNLLDNSLNHYEVHFDIRRMKMVGSCELNWPSHPTHSRSCFSRLAS